MRGGFIAIDGGNSRLKVTRLPVDPDIDIEIIRFDPGDSEAVMECVERWKSEGPLQCAMAVTGKFDARLAESLRQALGDDFLVMTPATELPVGMEYKTPETLGLDRKATACGAARRYPEECVMVVDAGTALTIDLVDRGTFKGGNISPGLRMRFRALHDYTARLPLIERPAEASAEFGRDTREAISAGVTRGWVDEVAGAAVNARAAGCRRILLAGGDAPLLATALPERMGKMGIEGFEIEYHPHLLAEGMQTIYRHYENRNK